MFSPNYIVATSIHLAMSIQTLPMKLHFPSCVFLFVVAGTLKTTNSSRSLRTRSTAWPIFEACELIALVLLVCHISQRIPDGACHSEDLLYSFGSIYLTDIYCVLHGFCLSVYSNQQRPKVMSNEAFKKMVSGGLVLITLLSVFIVH